MTRLFGAKPAARKSPSGASRPSADNPATVEDDSESSMRRQLIHVLLRDSLRRHGLSPDWIDCQILVVSSRSRGAGMYVRLVVRHWDERLMRYLLAFQKSIQTDIARFEPRAAEWLHGISWQLEPENECPYGEMPDKSFWLAPAPAPVPAPATAAVADTAVRPTSLNAAEMAAAVRQANAARRAAPIPAVASGAPDSRFPVFAATVPAGAEDRHGASSASRAKPEEDDAKSDLEALFAIRDRNLGATGAAKSGASDYDKTEPSPL
jgi:hypothetical protein